MSIFRPVRTLEDLKRTVRAIAASPPALQQRIILHGPRKLRNGHACLMLPPGKP